MQRVLAVRGAALAARGFASEAEASPSVIQVVMGLQDMHLKSLERLHDEIQAFRQEVKGMLDKLSGEDVKGMLNKLSGEVREVREQQVKLNSFVRWSVGAVPVMGVVLAFLKSST